MNKPVAIVAGTRPEAIKLAPLILEFRNRAISHIIIHTGQHDTLSEEVLGKFEIEPDYNLKIMSQAQTPAGIMSKVLQKLPPLLQKTKPGFLIVQGDTSSAVSAAQAAFLGKIPVAHVEAGLRSFDLNHPFPEELNRMLISQIASVHFAPTLSAKNNLLRENINPENIYLTGNTVTDALFHILSRTNLSVDDIREKYCISPDETLVLLTSHRRENFGVPQKKIFRSVLKLADLYPETRFIYPVHPNPAITENLNLLKNHSQIQIISPPAYFDFVPLLAASDIVMTDSGGIQEEAPSLGKPVIVLREKTERPELIKSGIGILAGSNEDLIINGFKSFINQKNRKINNQNLFGDGNASARITDFFAGFAIKKWYGAKDY